MNVLTHTFTVADILSARLSLAMRGGHAQMRGMALACDLHDALATNDPQAVIALKDRVRRNSDMAEGNDAESELAWAIARTFNVVHEVELALTEGDDTATDILRALFLGSSQ